MDKKIILVFKTHFDIGYTALAEEVMDDFVLKMLPDVIKTCRETKHMGDKSYVWTLPSWPLLYALRRGKLEKGVRDELNSLIEERKIVWHALPFTTHTEFCGLEEYIRGMYFSKQLSEEYGHTPISAKMTDVPGHTWILPSLLSAAGIKFLHLGCNPCSMPPDVPQMFFWEGPDGSRVLTYYSKGSYGTTLSSVKGWDYPIWLALMHTNDNTGPQSTEEVEKIIADAQKENPGAVIKTGTLDDFYNEIIKCDLSGLPVLKTDLADSWIHGAGTYPNEVGRLRKLRSKLTETEKLLSLMTAYEAFGEADADEYFNKLEECYEQSLLFGEHTWGLDVKAALGDKRLYKKEDFLAEKKAGKFIRIEASWDEQVQKVEMVESALEYITPNIADTLAQKVDFKGERIVVFNGLGWKRDADVELTDYKSRLQGKKLLDIGTNEEIKLFSGRGKLYAKIKDMPGMGYKTLSVAEADGKPRGTEVSEASVIENKYYKIEADADTGAVLSLYDKSRNKEWVDSDCKERFGQFSYDVYGMDDLTEYIRSYVYRFSDWIIKDIGRVEYHEIEHKVYKHKDFTVSAEKCDGMQTLIIRGDAEDESVAEYGDCEKTKMRIKIYDDAPYIDFELSLTDKKESPYIEAGHLAFPFNIKEPDIKINKLGSVVDPSVDIRPNSNNALYCCENWMDISDEECGMCVIPMDAPLFSVGGKGIHKFKSKYTQEGALVYFNLFNNQWGTNFPQWMGGDYVFRYRMLPHDKNTEERLLQKEAMGAMYELLAGYAQNGDEENALPRCLDFIAANDGMAVVSLKKADDGNGYIVRLRDISGEKRQACVVFGDKVKKIIRCTLLEKDICEAAPSSELNLATEPYQIHTFRILL